MAFLDRYRRKDTFRMGISGMTCENCESKVHDAIMRVPGVVSVEVSHEVDAAIVRTRRGAVSQAAINEAVRSVGYEPEEF